MKTEHDRIEYDLETIRLALINSHKELLFMCRELKERLHDLEMEVQDLNTAVLALEKSNES